MDEFQYFHPNRGFASRSTFLVIVLVISFVVAGFVEAAFGWSDQIDSPSFILHGILIAVICFAWCKADVEERKVEMPVGSAILCAVIPVIGIPLHFYRTRTAKQASLAVLKSIGITLVAILGYELSMQAWYFIGA